MHHVEAEVAEEGMISMDTTRGSLAQAIVVVVMDMMQQVVTVTVITLGMLVHNMELACRWYQ